MITKGKAAGGAVVVLGTGATVGGILGTKKTPIEIENESGGPPLEPSWSLLSFDNNFETEYSGDVIGKKFGWYLIGTYGVPNDVSKDNEDWWKWSFKMWEADIKENKDSLSSEFNEKDKVQSGFSTLDDNKPGADKAMNKVCQKIYRKKVEEVEFKKKDENDNKFKLGVDLLKYCSPLSKKPLTIADNGEETNYSSDTDFLGYKYRDTLISTKRNSINFLFWQLRNDEFFGKNGKNGTGVGLDSTKDSLFYKAYSERSSQQSSGNLENTCSLLYSSQESEDSYQTQKETTLKFCSWDYRSTSPD